MITINEKSYSGNVVSANSETLTVMIHTADSFQDVLANTLNVNQITDTDKNVVYNVTGAVRANVIEHGVYYIVFSCKPSAFQELLNRINQQDNAIDDILVMLLGGNENG